MRKIPFYIMKQNVQHGFRSEISSSRHKLKSGQQGFELKCAFFMWPRKSHHPSVRRLCVLFMWSVIDANPSVSALLLVYLHKLRISDSLYVTYLYTKFSRLVLRLSILFSVKTLCSELGALHLYIYLCRFLYCCQFWGNNLTIQSYQRTCIVNDSYLGKF